MIFMVSFQAPKLRWEEIFVSQELAKRKIQHVIAIDVMPLSPQDTIGTHIGRQN
jgi:hypothetical protein